MGYGSYNDMVNTGIDFISLIGDKKENDERENNKRKIKKLRLQRK